MMWSLPQYGVNVQGSYGNDGGPFVAVITVGTINLYRGGSG